MPSKTIQELRGLSEAELKDKIIALKKELMEMRFQAAGGRLQKSSRMPQAKREIARILTIQRSKKGSGTFLQIKRPD